MTTRLTAKAVSKRSGISERLIRGVLRQLGGGSEAWASLRDVCRGGADAGFHGFTYYRDTVGFFRRYRAEIVELAERQAQDFGQSVAEMVADFRCLDIRADDTIGQNSVLRCLGGGRLRDGGEQGDQDDLVANALAWYALEEVARAACDE